MPAPAPGRARFRGYLDQYELTVTRRDTTKRKTFQPGPGRQSISVEPGR